MLRRSLVVYTDFKKVCAVSIRVDCMSKRVIQVRYSKNFFPSAHSSSEDFIWAENSQSLLWAILHMRSGVMLQAHSQMACITSSSCLLPANRFKTVIAPATSRQLGTPQVCGPQGSLLLSLSCQSLRTQFLIASSLSSSIATTAESAQRQFSSSKLSGAAPSPCRFRQAAGSASYHLPCLQSTPALAVLCPVAPSKF